MRLAGNPQERASYLTFFAKLVFFLPFQLLMLNKCHLFAMEGERGRRGRVALLSKYIPGIFFGGSRGPW